MLKMFLNFFQYLISELLLNKKSSYLPDHRVVHCKTDFSMVT